MRPQYEIADLFRSHRHLLGPRSYHDNKIIKALVTCRTPEQGGHVYACDNEGCGHQHIAYNSCRNRHCPKCQGSAKELWIEKRVEELLPIPYYHMVFTVPHSLNVLFLWNRKIMFDILFKASSEAVRDLFASRYDATPGMISLLHTWGSNLSFHPHIHMVVTGGGLGRSQHRWIPARENYALSVKALSQIFRGKFLSFIREVKRELRLPEPLQLPGGLEDLLDQSFSKDWVVYAKKPFAAPIHVIRYLGNYTHRVAISNHRILSVDEDKISFSYKKYQDGSHNPSEMTLMISEFLRRFLSHVVPKRFVRIRFYGFLGTRYRKNKVATARTLIAQDKRLKQLSQSDLQEIIAEYKRSRPIKSDKCPICKVGVLGILQVIERFWNDSS